MNDSQTALQDQKKDSGQENRTREVSNKGRSSIQGDALTESDAEKPEVVTYHPRKEVDMDTVKPDSTYIKNGYEYKTNEYGHTVRAYGDLKLKEGQRSGLEKEVGNRGRETDEGGHLIGERFNGPSDAFNLVPQDAHLNRSEWKTMENSWAKALENGQKVTVLIEPKYHQCSPRPYQFEVLTKIDKHYSLSVF